MATKAQKTAPKKLTRVETRAKNKKLYDEVRGVDTKSRDAQIKVIADELKESKVGRPTDYTIELGARICEQIALGYSIRKVVRENPDFPAISTIYIWKQKHEKFAEQYTQAQIERSEAMHEEILEIADDGTNDWMENSFQGGKTPGWELNGENIQRSKLRIETRKWLMEKMKPKKYGEHIDVTSDGRALPAPILGSIIAPRKEPIEGEVVENNSQAVLE